jgi:pyruvate,water dikinase
MRAPCIHWLNELGQEHGDVVGKKCANLGELTRLGVRVPPGFAIGVDAYLRYMELTGLSGRLAGYFAGLGDELKRSFSMQIEASRCAQELIRSAPLPAELGEHIEESYEALCDRCGTADVPVAVRSSGAVSMPGQLDTYLQVRGSAEVKQRVTEVWESTFNTRAIAFRLERGMAVDRAPIGVGVLEMVNAKSAGVVLTVDPLTGETDRVVIEGNWGLGESVASGEMTPDHFVVTKESAAIDRTVGRKVRWVVSTGRGTVDADLPHDLQDAPCLTDDEVRELARVAVDVERHFGTPQDLEWVIDRELPFPRNVFWVQARPATYTPKTRAAETDYLVEQMARLFRR